MSQDQDISAEDAEVEASEKEAEKASFLTFEVVETVYEADNLAQAFLDIRSEMKKVEIKKFASVAAAIGTHSLKTLTPRASQSYTKKSQSVFTVGDHQMMFSGNAAESAYAKALLRPVSVRERNAPISLIEAIVRGGAFAENLKEAFAVVFGEDALSEVVSAAGQGLKDITALPPKNFPIVFLPHPDGDVQATPISPLSSFMSSRKEAGPFMQKKTSADDTPRRGRFKRTEVSSKMQNVSPQLFGGKLRMIATLPRLSDSRQAMIWSFANGGRFPRMDDLSIGDMLVSFAKLNEADIAGASSPRVTEAMASIMRVVVSDAVEHAVSCCEEAYAVRADFVPPADVTLSYLTLHLVKRRIQTAKSGKQKEEFERDLVIATAAMSGSGQKWGDVFASQYDEYVKRKRA